MKAESSVNDLIESLQQPLSESELEKMLRPETAHPETDAYTTLLNHFTQKNTDALVKCIYTFSLLRTADDCIVVKLSCSKKDTVEVAVVTGLTEGSGG